jgi:hypothetical protein
MPKSIEYETWWALPFLWIFRRKDSKLGTSGFNTPLILKKTGKGKTLPAQAWTGDEGSSRLRLPEFMTIGTGNLLVLLTCRLYPPGNIPLTGGDIARREEHHRESNP